MIRKICCAALAALLLVTIGAAEESWLYPARRGGLWGYIDGTGAFVIAPQWDAAGDLRGAGYAWVRTIPEEREVFSDEEGWHIESVAMEGIIDRSGAYVLPPSEAYADEGYSGEFYGGRDTGVIVLGSTVLDVADGSLLPAGWDYWAWGLHHEKRLLPVYGGEEGEMGFIDRETGELVIDCLYVEPCGEFREGFALVFPMAEGEYLLIDERGEELLLPEGITADWRSEFSEGLSPVLDTKSGLYGFCSLKGELMIDARYEDVCAFSEGYAAVCTDGLWGHIDRQGNVACAPQFEAGYSFINGLAVVWGSEGDCVIRPDGTIVFSRPGARIWDFDAYGVALFDVQGCMGIVNRSGEVLLDPAAGYRFVSDYAYGFAQAFPQGLMRVKKDGKIGFVSREGMLVVPCVWDDAQPFDHGLARVDSGGKMAYIDLQGNVIWREE